MRGTCLYAAAWNTTTGLNLAKTACIRAGLRTSPMMGAMSGFFLDDRNSCSMQYKAYSFSSSRTRRSGSNFAIWRASSEPIEPAVVEHHLVAAEQVLQFDAADLGYRDLTRQQVVVGGHGEDRQPCGGGDFRCTPAHPCGRSRQRDDRMAGLQLLRPAADFAESPKHLDAQKDLPLPSRVVVEYPDRAPLTGAPHRPQQIDGDVAGADHEHRFAGEMDVAVEGALPPGAIGDPAARHDRGKQKRRKDESGRRHVDVGAEEREQRGHRERPDQAGERYAFQVGQARVAPAAPVQAKRPEYQRVQGNG